MKTIKPFSLTFLSILFFSFCFFFENAVSAQSSTKIIPDILGLPPSTSHHILENKGQLINDTGAAVAFVKYYTFSSLLNHYFLQDRVVFQMPVFKDSTYSKSPSTQDSAVKTLDSVYRIDFEFAGGYNASASMNVYQKDSATYNFHLPQCGSGIDSVESFRRVVYEGIYSDIDYNFYSSSSGIIHYMVIYPGGNPSDIAFNFNGFSSLSVYSDHLRGRINDEAYDIGQPIAYQFDGTSTIYPMTWYPEYRDNGSSIGIHLTGTYDESMPLVIVFPQMSASNFPDLKPIDLKNPRKATTGTAGAIQNMEWATIFGYRQVGIATDNIDIYVASKDYTSSFPVTVGKYNTLNGSVSGVDIQVAKFNTDGRMKWVTVIGSSWSDGYYGDKGRMAITVKPNGSVYVADEVWNNDLRQKTESGATNIASNCSSSPDGTKCTQLFISRLEPSTGFVKWLTFWDYYTEESSVNDLISDKDNNLYLIAACPGCSLKNPGSGAYYSTNGVSTISKFNSNDLFQWGTKFGSPNSNLHLEEITSAVCINNDLYITGWTPNYNFPISNAAQTTYGGGGGDAFVAKFNSNNGLDWSTFYGGDDVDRGLDLDVIDGKVYVGGGTQSHESGGFPTYKDASYSGHYDNTFNGGSLDGFLAIYNSNGSLFASTYMGGDKVEEVTSTTNCGLGFLEVGGYTSGTPGGSSTFPIGPSPYGNYYTVATHSNYPMNLYDAYFQGFNSQTNIKWGSLYGSKSKSNEVEVIQDAKRVGDYVFIVGRTALSGGDLTTFAPTTNSYLKQASTAPAGFILRFNMSTTNLDVPKMSTINKINIYPNPTFGKVFFDLRSDIVYKCYLYDISGKEVLHETLNTDKNFLDFSKIAKGMYLMKVISDKDEDMISYEKIILE